MANKITDIAAKILSVRERQAAAAAELVELERQQKWQQGEERRQRLAELRAEAEQDLGSNEATDIAAAAKDLAEAAVRLHETCAARNKRLQSLHARAVRENVKAGPGGDIPPSPADAGVGLVQGGIVVGRRRVHPVDTARFQRLALEAAAEHARTGKTIPDFSISVAGLEDEQPAFQTTGRYFWKNRNHGGVFTSQRPDQYAHQEGMERIDARQYLEAVWGVQLDQLPADVRTDAEEAMPA